MRYIRPETTLLWFGFFIRGLGYENLAIADPSMTKTPDPLEPTNNILSFFIGAFIFICIGIV